MVAAQRLRANLIEVFKIFSKVWIMSDIQNFTLSTAELTGHE